MSYSNLIRLGALAAMGGGVLFLVGPFVPLVGHPFLYLLGFPVREYGILYALYGISSVVAFALILAGMVGFHILQRHSYGRKGQAGLWLVLVVSMMMVLGGVVFFTLGEAGDFLQATPPLVWVALGLSGLVGGLVSMGVGFGLYGVATLEAKVLPCWCGVAFIAALPVALALSVSLTIYSMPPVFGLAWLALGYALWARREAPTVQQSRQVR